ncbi:hypothetical protein [Kushneria konosiri]|uniref:Uncharacterized protein n=1 Tax=Kushneria konosiri TaxID=698828 RepID=A0A2Z2H8V6_9GAMM|nr:hypothetical protein [Kushneria konosiri]ARS53784.1 hypothetical protein B9G99_13685 [Kushneria konosiri]
MSFLLLMNEGRPTPWLLIELSLGNVARLLWAALLLVDQRIDGRHRASPVGAIISITCRHDPVRDASIAGKSEPDVDLQAMLG